MTLLDRFSQDDLIAQLGMETVAKGLGYLSRVSALSTEGSEVSALVKGRQRTPYDVFANVVEEDGRPALVSGCSCPMGYDCKHVAAMMLLWLHQRRRPDRPRQQVLAWVEGFRHAASALDPSAARKRKSTASKHALHYVIEPDSEHGEDTIACYKVRLDQQGQIRQRESWSNFERALQDPPAFVDETDLEILRLLWAHRPRGRTVASAGLPLEGRNSSELMGKLLASERVHFASLANPLLNAGEARPGTPDWTLTADGLRAPVLKVEPAAERILPLLPPCPLRALSPGQIGPSPHAGRGLSRVSVETAPERPSRVHSSLLSSREGPPHHPL